MICDQDDPKINAHSNKNNNKVKNVKIFVKKKVLV